MVPGFGFVPKPGTSKDIHMNRYILAMVLSALMLSAYCTEVGGHIMRNTTWTPENSPYVITSFLYIDNQVTLTILPGTQVRCSGADKSSIYSFMWSGNNQPISKMIIVNGRINAIGTPDQPITFDKYQDDIDFRWGGIYMSPGAQVSSFEYCEFRNAFFCDYIPGDWSLAAIDFHNGIINVRSCVFENNLNAIRTGYLQSDILLYDCKFISIDDTYPTPFGLTGFIGFSAAPQPEPDEHYKVTIAKCIFRGAASMGPVGYYMDVLFLNNVTDNFLSRNEQSQEQRSEYGSMCSYGNISYYGSRGWGCTSAAGDTVYARRNRLIKPVNANPGNRPLRISSDGYGTNYVSDNYLHGCVQVYTMQTNATTNYMYNNIIEHNYWSAAVFFENINPSLTGGQLRFYNNLLMHIGNDDTYIASIHYTSPYIFNNTFIKYNTLHYSLGNYQTTYANNIVDVSYSLGFYEGLAPQLINNCLSIPIPPESDIIGEGNIVADPLFADTLNANYSLTANSPCIDAGAFRPDLPDFDIRYYRRITPGSPGDSLAVDIGAYEYNSQYIGGLRGMVFDAISGEMIDCAKIEISQKLPEFSDTLGSFVYPTGPGVFTVHASRWDYEDQVIENVVVNEGDEILVTIPMYPTGTAVEDNTTPSIVPKTLRNYPNPFNPETTISFIASKPGRVKLKIYNLKGQLVQTLYDDSLQEGYHSFPWNGRDENGGAVSSGIYIARIEMNGEIQVHKMMLVK